MKNELTTIDHDQLTTICGGTVATSPWATFEADLKSRIDSELAEARSRFDKYRTVPTAPTMPTGPNKYPRRSPGTYGKV